MVSAAVRSMAAVLLLLLHCFFGVVAPILCSGVVFIFCCTIFGVLSILQSYRWGRERELIAFL